MTNWDNIFYYDETSPSFLRWRIKSANGNKKPGDVARTKDEDGYWVVRYKGKDYRAHRVIYEMYYGKIPDGCEIDHKNRIPSDNRIDNLELTGRTGNCRNQSKKSNNTSGDTGVRPIEVNGLHY